MRKLLTIILLGITLLFSFAYLDAAVKVKVKGTVETKRKKPKPEEIKTATYNAKILAIKKYASEKDSRRRELINELLWITVRRMETGEREETQDVVQK